MAIVLPGDLDVFFDAEGFGEAVSYTPSGGAAVPATAIWHRNGAELGFGNVRVPVEQFSLRTDQVGVPVAGASIAVDRTGERFRIEPHPTSGADRCTWLCTVTPE